MSQPHKEIVETILQALRENNVPWRRQYDSVTSNPIRFSNKAPYRGINVLHLALVSQMRGYTSPYWLTRKQIYEGGGFLSENDANSAVPVMFWKMWNPDTKKFEDKKKEVDKPDDLDAILKTDSEDDNIEDPEVGLDPEKREEAVKASKLIPVTMTSLVYNGDVVRGHKKLKKLHDEIDAKRRNFDHNPIETCEALIKEAQPYMPPIDHKTKADADIARACYIPSQDRVEMPPINRFFKPESYYHTLFHEWSHGTGHKSRLNRDQTGVFGSRPYAKEELIAEIGAWFLSNHTRIMGKVDIREVERADENMAQNRVAYIQSWIETLENNPNILISAAQRADKVFRFVVDGPNFAKKQTVDAADEIGSIEVPTSITPMPSVSVVESSGFKMR